MRARASSLVSTAFFANSVVADVDADGRQDVVTASTVAFLDGAQAPASATQVIGQTELLVPLAGLIDFDAERARLEREEEKLGKEIEKLAGRLGNTGVVDKAPPEVVARERARLAELEGAREALARQREGLGSSL